MEVESTLRAVRKERFFMSGLINEQGAPMDSLREVFLPLEKVWPLRMAYIAMYSRILPCSGSAFLIRESRYTSLGRLRTELRGRSGCAVH